MYQTSTTTEIQGASFFGPYYKSTEQEDIHTPSVNESYREILSKLFSHRSISCGISLPSQETVNETVQVIVNESAFEVEVPDYDVFVNMPPRDKYTITLEVVSVRKAQPNIVEPAWY